MKEPRSLREVFLCLAHDPWEMLGRRWNYKAAVLSSAVRGCLFFAANTGAGLDAAYSAATTEVLLRLATSGFYGALTQSFRRVEPAWAATLSAMLLLPTVAHSLELLVHWMRGTPALAVSIAISIAFTTVSTAFNLFAMRHGVLVVGERGCSIWHDLTAMPRLVTLFIRGAARSFARACL